jgi:hypothetical protein
MWRYWRILMRQWRKIIIFASALIVLIALLVVSSLIKGNGDSSSKDVTPVPSIPPVLSVNETDISIITIKNNEGTLEFSPATTKNESGTTTTEWLLTSPSGVKFSKSIIGSKVSNYTNITANVQVSAKTDNLAEYGLESPVATVIVKLKSGTENKVIYGNKAPDGSSYYAMLVGSSRILTVSSTYADDALITVLDILDTNIFNSITIDNLDAFSFQRAKDNAAFTAKSNGDADTTNKTPATWRILTPFAVEASTEGFSPFLTELLAVSPASFVKMSPESFTEYGLDKPDYDYTFTSTEGKKVRCILGGDAGGGALYGYTDYSDAVFKTASGSLTLIDKPFIELVNSFIYMPSIWDVKAVDISLDTTKIHCDIKDSQEKETASDFKVNGKDANVVSSDDDSYFRSFYQSLISIFIKGVDIDAKPVYKPSITIKYTMNDASKNIELGFVKRDEMTFFVFKNAKYQGYFVSRDDFYSDKKDDEGILPAYNILMNAIDNQVDGKYK